MKNKKQSLKVLDVTTCYKQLMQESNNDVEACFRELADDGTWTCVNDHTGCLWNDGHNECGHEGDKSSPLEEEE